MWVVPLVIAILVRERDAAQIWRVACAACCFLLFFTGFARADSISKEIQLLEKISDSCFETISLEGKISGINEKSGRFIYELNDCKIQTKEGLFQGDNLLVVFDGNTGGEYGDLVRIKGNAEPFHRARNPGNFDERNYYRSLGTALQISGSSMVIEEKARIPIEQFLHEIRKKLENTLHTVCSEKDAAIFCALLLGEKDFLDQETKDLYRDGGIIHILSISGLHLSIIGSGLYNFVRKKFRFLPSALISFVLVVAFGVMTGTPVSLVRALIMFSLKLAADVSGRTYDMPIAGAVAAGMVLWNNPFYLSHSGFQLSFLAVGGIAIALPVIQSFFFSKYNLVKAFQASLAVTVLTGPVILNIYFEIPAYAVFLNMAVIPFMEIVLLSGMLSSVAGTILPWAGYLPIGIGAFILRFYELLCKLFGILPFALIPAGRMPQTSIWIYYLTVLIALALMAAWRQKNPDLGHSRLDFRKKGFGIFVGLILILLLLVRKQEDLRITIVDMGQGEAIVIELPGGRTLCVDAGSSDIMEPGRYRLFPYLRSRGITEIDYFLSTHLDEDHVRALNEILEDPKESGVKVGTILLSMPAGASESGLQIRNKAEKAGVKIRSLETGDLLSESGFLLRCIHPSSSFSADDPNEASMVLQLKYGEFQMLLTGDIGEKGEQALINSSYLNDCDVLKVAHHGSKFSSSEEFLRAVSPEYAVISCSEDNVYGHPHEETLKRLEKFGTEVMTTAEKGAIFIQSNGKNYHLNTYLESSPGWKN